MRLVLDIAGIKFGIVHDNRAWGELIKKRYNGFVSSGLCSCAIHVDAKPRYSTRSKNLSHSARQRPDGNFDLLWYDMKGVFYPGENRCDVTLQDSEFSINNVMRVLMSHYIQPSGGMLLHAASFRRGGRAYVFPGVSTAGKSTLSRLTVEGRPECEILTDEISILRKVRGRWRAFGSPFWGDLMISGENVSAPVRKVLFIEKAVKHSMGRISRAEAFSRLVQNSMYVSRDRSSVTLTMRLAGDLLDSVEVGVLGFNLSPSFWDML